jgi:cytochrome c-type biogenesis protein CcmH/NrfG
VTNCLPAFQCKGNLSCLQGCLTYLLSARRSIANLVKFRQKTATSTRITAMRMKIRLAASLISLGTLASLSQVPNGGEASRTTNSVAESEACASCHADIYKSYSTTVMATASGPATSAVITGEFTHKPSGVHYSVFKQDGRVWMSYDRPSEKGFHGRKELLYFIGSGVKGRTYLFSVDGFLFEAPINWYSQEAKWNMTPGYTEAQEIPMNLPAYPSCLNCHTSGMRAPVEGTDNRFSGEPFSHGGITCERCHGSGNAHNAGKGTIVNPAKLPPQRRDAVCMECHFEGTVAVEQPGKKLYEFQPGERLSDYEHYFLLQGAQPEKARALSQFEALSLSACKQKSRDRMWCGSCHDPHKEPTPAEKPTYYREKCLACHGQGREGKTFAAKHHPDKPDCTACHMPELPSKDVAHTETTDHRITRFPNAPPLPQLELRGMVGAPLMSFPKSDAPLATTRDFALAWETLAHRGVDGAARRAEEYLQKAVKDWPDDPTVLTSLGFVEQEHKNESDARELYERALKTDPMANEAAVNLGMIEARTGNLRRAVELWQGAFARAPYRSVIGMNLAIAFCAAGQKDEARQYVQRVLEFNPDYERAKSLLAHLNADPVQCRP